MLTPSDVFNALNYFSDDINLTNALNSLQFYHPPKHLTTTHVRPPNTGFGDGFFMKKRMVKVPVVKQGPWGKPVTTLVNTPSDAFGDYEGVTRLDEGKIVNHLKSCDFGSYSFTSQADDSFIFFTDIPAPYVGFDWVIDKCLPVEGGYLAFVLKLLPSGGWRIKTIFPCTRSYYMKHACTVIHK